MARKILESCPSCGGELEIRELRCGWCETEIRSYFKPCDFCRLTEEQSTFLRLFVTSRGNLSEVEKRLGVSYLFIAHDLAAVAHMSRTIAVMYLGKIVEIGDADAIALEPKHPYTKALFAAALPIDLDRPREEITLSGEVPSPLAPPTGCRFHPRCPFAMPHCATEEPALRPESGRLVACHLY